MCLVLFEIKKEYQKGCDVCKAYSFVVDNSAGWSGQRRSCRPKFIFEKYEEGWKIKDVVKYGVHDRWR